ncbi:MAG: hypothetical protein U0905_22365 [Pirellulales bacterium]
MHATSVNEDGTVTLSGTYIDVGTQDTHTLTIDWGEGAPVTLPVSGGTFSFTHQYLDDNPTNTSSDTHTIGVVLTDDDTGTAVGKRYHHDYQREPRDSHVACHLANEDGTVTLGTYIDVGTQDTGYPDDRLGRRRASATLPRIRRYVQLHASVPDDNPTNTSSDTYTIGVVLTDDGCRNRCRVTTTITNANLVEITLHATSVNEAMAR